MNRKSAFLVRPVRIEGRRELGHATPGYAEFPVQLLTHIRRNCKQLDDERRRLLADARRGKVRAQRQLWKRFGLRWTYVRDQRKPITLTLEVAR